MKFITVRDLRTSPAQIWKALPEEQEMVLTNNGKPIALITPINEFDLEETLSSVRKARAQSSLQKMQFSSISNKVSFSEEEIEAAVIIAEEADLVIAAVGDTLKAGESKIVPFTLTKQNLTLIDKNLERIFEPGEFDIMIGSSSKKKDLIVERIYLS